MSFRAKRRLAWAALPVGIVLAAASVTVLTWGLGLVLGAFIILCAYAVLTDSPDRPANTRYARQPARRGHL